jgi:hypothetical protein
MSLKLLNLLGKYALDIRQAKDALEIIDLKDNLYIDINTLFSLQGVVNPLKVKNALSFEDWIEFNYHKTDDELVYKIDRIFYSKEDLRLIYKDYLKSL